MKKKKNKIVWIILLLAMLFLGMVYLYTSQSVATQITTNSDSSSSQTTKEVSVSTQTITNTLTSSGEIGTATTESLNLNTYRYFSEVYVEENDFMEEGANILKYTNGTYLTAPYDCVITKLTLPEESEKCTSQHLVQVQSTEELLMTLSIDEEDIAKVEVGQEVEITVNAYEDKTYTGSITKINQIGSYASNGSSFTATVKFANDGNVKIGMSASCSVTLEKAENVLAVPVEAVQTKENQKYVVVKSSDGTTKNITVETGISNDAYVEITSGLTGTETIEMTVTTSSNSSNRGMGGASGQGFGGGEMRQEMQSGTMPSMPTSGTGVKGGQ